MTETTILVVTGPLLIAILASLSLGVAGLSLRSGAHVQVWAVALGLSSLQWAILALHSMPGARLFGGWHGSLAGDLIGLVAMILYAHGFRLRHDSRRDDKPFLAAAILACLIFTMLSFDRSDKATAAAFLAAIKALFLFWAATKVFASRFRSSPSERAAAGMLVTIGGLAIVLAIGAYTGDHDRFTWAARFLARILVAGPASAATALFTILLIASDHSAERRRLVYTDPLTGLLNRLGFDALSRAVFRRRRRAFSVAIADIDHFKAINDRHGHAVGDAVLAGLAGELAKGLRPDEIAARIGGEEFALLLNDRGAAALSRIEAMRGAVIDLRLGALPDLRITASFGVTEYARGEPLERTIGRADSALYRSKHDGRNRATLAEPLTA